MKKLFVLFAAVSLFMTGCGSSGSSGSSKPEPKTVNTIEGVLADPYISGARIELVKADGTPADAICGTGGNAYCATFTGPNGVFKLSFPLDADISGYYLTSTGGTDEEYAIQLGTVSFASAIALFDNGTEGDYTGVVISPVTTVAARHMMDGSTAEMAAALTLAAFGLPEGTDIAADPVAEGGVLLKASYLFTKTALLKAEQNSVNPVDKLFSAIKANPNALFTSSAVLEAVFGTGAAAVMAVQTTAANLDNLTGADMPAQIADSERRQLFTAALLKTISGVPTDVDAAFYTNAAALYAKISGLMDNGSMPMSSFSSGVMVKFIIRSNSFFGAYSNYTGSAAFTNALSSIVPPAQIDTFKASLRRIATEKVYMVSVPLDAPLGDNNSAKIEYYLNSELDNNYRARMLIRQLQDDSITDTVYKLVTTSYASHGLHAKAVELARTYLIGTLDRANAIIEVAQAVAPYDAPTAIAYLDEAEIILASLRGNGSSIDTDLANAYAALSIGHDRAVNYTKAKAVRSQLLADIEASTIDEAMKAYLRSSNIMNFRNFVDLQLRPAGEYAQARDILDYALELVRQMPADETSLYMGKRFNHAMHLAFIAQYFEHNQFGNPTYAKAKAKEACELMWSYRGDVATTSDMSGWGGYGGFAIYSIGACMWAIGNDAFDNTTSAGREIEKDMNEVRAYYASSTGIRHAIVGTFNVKGLTAALALLEREYPIDEEGPYSNLGVWLDLLNYQNVNSNGMGVSSSAYYTQGYDKLKEVMVYMETLLDTAKTYCVDNNKNCLSDLVSAGYDSTLIDRTSIEAIKSTGFYESGYLQMAHMFYKAMTNVNEPASVRAEAEAKGRALIAKAEAYTDTVAASLSKMRAYVTLAHYYELYNMRDNASFMYDKALAITPTVTTDADYASLYYERCNIAKYGHKKEAGKVNADQMAYYADRLYNEGGKEANASNEIKYLIYAAYAYHRHGYTAEAAAVLEKALNTAGNILSAYTKTSRYKDIIVAYGRIDMIDEAYAKIPQYLTKLADQNSAISNLAQAVIERNDFGVLGIAFVDTDKDGKPDFFSPLASAEDIARLGLQADDDSDGDGKPDSVDLTPFFAD